MHTPQQDHGEQDHGEQDHGEQEREPGLGGRVRRFVESELGRVLDKGERRPGRDEAHPVGTAPPEAGGGPAPDWQAPPAEVRGEPVAGEPVAATAAGDSTAPVALLDDAAELREQWRRIQGRFVDDPQGAVHEAGRLVERTLDEIRAHVESKPPGEEMSTDELRLSFRRYREFFQRLLSA